MSAPPRVAAADAAMRPAPLEAQLAETLRGSPPATRRDAVAVIRGWHETLRTLSAVAEVQVMAACWRLRQIAPSRETFEEIVTEDLEGVLRPNRAWVLADTWDAARRQRAVSRLVSVDPSSAIAFIRDLTAAIPDATELDEDDRRIAALLAAPPRQRREQLRLWSEAAAGTVQRQPGDAERERDVARTDAAATRRGLVAAGPGEEGCRGGSRSGCQPRDGRECPPGVLRDQRQHGGDLHRARSVPRRHAPCQGSHRVGADTMTARERPKKRASAARRSGFTPPRQPDDIN